MQTNEGFRVMRRLLLIVLLLVLATVPAAAQDTDVTTDDVNEIAGKMYCPVCENIPLDTCGTAGLPGLARGNSPVPRGRYD